MSGTKISTRSTLPLSPLGWGWGGHCYSKRWRETTEDLSPPPTHTHQNSYQVWGGGSSLGSTPACLPTQSPEKLTEDKNMKLGGFPPGTLIAQELWTSGIAGGIFLLPGTWGHFSEPTESLLHASEGGWPYATFKGRRISTKEYQLRNRTLWSC